MSKKIMQLLLMVGYFVCCYSQKINQSLARKDCFFGVHFDFHATKADSTIGKTLTANKIDSLLNEVKPDFVQVDCKGIWGIASYPTKVGTPAKGFVKDALQIWREETAKKGVGLYIHYSDLLDKAAVQKHPNWAALNADKQPSNDRVSIFSNYEDSLMIPQLKEVIQKYKVNGIWVDAGVFAIEPDYSVAALQAFSKKTGREAIPNVNSGAIYKTFLQFQRDAFAKYVSKYASELHQFDKNIEVCSNWLYSAVAPFPVPVNIDFLSGDMPSSQGDLHKVAFDARCYSSQARTYNKAWDLMSWGFDDKGIRPINVLCQEASEVIAEGGAWQCYFPQNHDASVNDNYINALQQIAPFLRARQAYCQYAIPIKQVAILFSGGNEFARNSNLFQNDNNALVRNTLYSLIDNQIPTEVIMEHQIRGSVPAYPLIVIPELGVAPEFQSQVLNYVSNGGTILLIGTNNVNQFAKYAGVTANTNLKKQIVLQGNDAVFPFEITSYALASGTTELKVVHSQNNNSIPVACVTNYGKGEIACFLINQSSASNDAMYEAYKKTVGSLTKTLLLNPVAEVEGSNNVHVTLNSLQKRTIVNLVNTSQANGNIIPELSSITVKLRIAKPLKIMLQPENKSLPFTYKDGISTVQVPKVPLHEIIVAE